MLEKTRRRMNIHRLVRFERPVRIAALLQLGLDSKTGVQHILSNTADTKGRTHRVVKVPRSDRFLDGRDIVRVGVALHDHFDALAQARELVPDIPRTTEALELQDLLIAELL